MYKISKRVQLVLLLCTFCVMLYFGLLQNSQHVENRLSWTPQRGIVFDNPSMVYTEQFIPMPNESDHFSLVIGITPKFYDTPRLGILLHIYDKANESQIIIGQWDKSLMVLNSNDYSNQRQEPKIYAKMNSEDSIQYCTIVSGTSGTKVYINGELRGQNSDLRVGLSKNQEPSKLVLGNDLYGITPWEGRLYHFALYNEELDGEIHQIGKRSQKDSIKSQYNKCLMYSLELDQRSLVLVQSDKIVRLIVPEKIISLNHSILQIPEKELLKSPTMKWDLLINYLGFLPFGFLIFIISLKEGSKSFLFSLFPVVLFSFFFSFGIEILQVFMIYRNSSLLDLLLNTLGGFSGGIIGYLYQKVMP